MRWSSQSVTAKRRDQEALPGLGLAEVAAVPGHLRTVRSPEFEGMIFHEVLAKSALNRVPSTSSMPFGWTINPYRGCSHACVYCFARSSHRYLDLDTGRDFDSQIVVKVNVAEVLARELAKPSWQGEHVALGTNTDPYQRAEGRYRLMPGIIEALAAKRTPFSILTKGTLLRRDLALLAEANERTRISLSMSIAIHDHDLQQSIEPGTPTTRARLNTIAAAREAGFACQVFVMPVLPHLTDSVTQLTRLLHDIREAGASSVIYGPLHLRSHVKPWFFEWLGREHPELLPAYRELYPGSSATAPKEYRMQLAERIRPLLRRFNLQPSSRRDVSGSSSGSGSSSTLGSALGSGSSSTLGSALGSGSSSTLGSALGSGPGSTSGLGSTLASGPGSTLGSGPGSALGSVGSGAAYSADIGTGLGIGLDAGPGSGSDSGTCTGTGTSAEVVSELPVSDGLIQHLASPTPGASTSVRLF